VGMAQTHIENTSFNTSSVVACRYCGCCLAIIGCVLVVGLFTKSLPSSGHFKHSFHAPFAYKSSLLLMLMIFFVLSQESSFS
jgi:hypothetical protein